MGVALTQVGMRVLIWSHHWFKQCQGLPVNAALKPDYIISGIPEIDPAKITELRLTGRFEIKLNIVITQLQQKPDLLLTNTKGLAL